MEYGDGAPIECHGYSTAKHGLICLTRAFLFSNPYVFDSEGIKCYALAPTGCDTNLVRSMWKVFIFEERYICKSIAPFRVDFKLSMICLI